MSKVEIVGHVALNADVPEVAALAEFAPCPVTYISAAAENTRRRTLFVHLLLIALLTWSILSGRS